MLIARDLVNLVCFVPVCIVGPVMALEEEIVKGGNLLFLNQLDQRLLVHGEGCRIYAVLLIDIFKRGQDHSFALLHHSTGLWIQREVPLKVCADMKVD